MKVDRTCKVWFGILLECSTNESFTWILDGTLQQLPDGAVTQ